MLDRKLEVHRRLSNGRSKRVGELAENQSGIYFQFDQNYLNAHHSLSPFALKDDTSLQLGPKTPSQGLHGVFADSLPDGWGLYLMDRLFRQNGIAPSSVSALTRLAFIGNNCLGALYYQPANQFSANDLEHGLNIQALGKLAIDEFEGTESDIVTTLMETAGSGGARPKINVSYTETGQYSTKPNAKGSKRIIKLTSKHFYLQQDESLVEHACMTLANTAGIKTAPFGLIDSGNGSYWLYQDRFDCVGDHGNYHMISAAGLLDISYREPALDYIELIKATRKMCGATDARNLLKRALFNFLICNQDDHAKNFAFLSNDNDQWSLSPFYDVVYSPSPYQQHMTSYDGNGKGPTHEGLKNMAAQANWRLKDLAIVCEQINDALTNANRVLKQNGVMPDLIKEITNAINTRQVNLAKAFSG